MSPWPPRGDGPRLGPIRFAGRRSRPASRGGRGLGPPGERGASLAQRGRDCGRGRRMRALRVSPAGWRAPTPRPRPRPPKSRDRGLGLPNNASMEAAGVPRPATSLKPPLHPRQPCTCRGTPRPDISGPGPLDSLLPPSKPSSLGTSRFFFFKLLWGRGIFALIIFRASPFCPGRPRLRRSCLAPLA